MGDSKTIQIDSTYWLHIGDTIGLTSVHSPGGGLLFPTIERADVVRIATGERPHSEATTSSRWRNCIEVVLRLHKDRREFIDLVIGVLDPSGNTKKFIDMSMFRRVSTDPAELHALAERLAGEVGESIRSDGSSASIHLNERL